MTSSSQKVLDLVAEIEREAYQKGWADAMAAVTASAAKLGKPGPQLEAKGPLSAPSATMATTKRRRGRRGKRVHVMSRVLQIIKERPGLLGVEIVRLIEQEGGDERAVRTALRRLRMPGTIDQKDKKWYAVESRIVEAA